MEYRLSTFAAVFEALPLWLLIFGIFTPVVLLLLLIIAYLRLELMEVNKELGMNHDPKDIIKEHFNKQTRHHSTEYRVRNTICNN
ncbi:small leucine-rich protein 1-like [Scyliorhinus canicula]|uniref:small leucine-rich protein 1-like n=1 Tax=Scyliorhinus canicula TaxID=7830 RepID=UPI0018F6F399|nr:small leucine-rich protein 1-like [Scyliorhinus canicula]